MNFVTFPVNSTNIFPIANSKAGGQLLSEFNIRSRETVLTDPNVKYSIGPSYTHSLEDFKVTLQTDGLGNSVSSSTIQIAEGKAIINGHYIESLVPIVIDIADANTQLVADNKTPLSGKLAVGLRVMYSTTSTMNGSMLVENDADMYQGIQVVILPALGDVGTKLTLPSDSPVDQSKVNAHLKLAEFEYTGGSIVSNSIINNEDKMRSIPADRITGVDALVSDEYVSKRGLDAKKLYTFAGKGTNPETGRSTWCESNDSLMVWDANPNLVTIDPTHPGPEVPEAQFRIRTYTNGNQGVELIVPHKQVDGMMSTFGTGQYYEDKYYTIPTASYSLGTPGVVDRNYTAVIKSIQNEIRNIYNLPQGKMIKYIDQLTQSNYADEFPTVQLPTEWVPGDYVLVREDYTVDVDTTIESAPSTMYILLPGRIKTLKQVDHETAQQLPDLPESLRSGVLLDTFEDTYEGLDNVQYVENEIDSGRVNVMYQAMGGGHEVADSLTKGKENLNNFRGTIDKDYFIFDVTKIWTDSSNVDHNAHEFVWYTPKSTEPVEFATRPLIITGNIPLAQEDVIGGFLNVPDTQYGGGYVRRNDDGYLQLVDYDLLATGVLAYQLGETFTCPSGLDILSIQTNLDEYVNNRVAFANDAYKADNPESYKTIHVYVDITVPEGSSAQTLYFGNIDSRFGTCVYLHVTGQVGTLTQLYIHDCEKLRLDIQASGQLQVVMKNCNLFYDPTALDSLYTIQDLRLWYERYSDQDPDLFVDALTVMRNDKPETVSSSEYWAPSTPNDNHFSYALRSITFNSEGQIIGCSLFVTDDMTSNIAEGTYIFTSEFSLPQSVGLPFPVSRLNKQLKVTGEYITAYPMSVTTPQGYRVKNTNFTALSEAYTNYAAGIMVPGVIAFHTEVEIVTAVSGLASTSSIDGWETGKFHIFSGGAID